jgi:lathosterol oxidase
MDIVLEVTDTFIADYVYAYLAPALPAPYDFPKGVSANASAQTFSSWVYTPATQFIQFQPSQAAYMSSLPRDNILRQTITLFFIYWCVLYTGVSLPMLRGPFLGCSDLSCR